LLERRRRASMEEGESEKKGRLGEKRSIRGRGKNEKKKRLRGGEKH